MPLPQNLRKSLNILAIAGMSWVATTFSAAAQLVPDNSLGSEGSLVTPNVLINGELTDRVDGGAARANNLFHSFLEFNVNDGQRVYFANPIDIENIVTRVTGLSESQINGTLGVDGSANLYVINPNGIVFGPNAELDIRGSFLGSTQEQLEFENGYVFSAMNSDVPPLLWVNTSPGLDAWLPTSGTVTNEANLSVEENLTLVGNVLNLQGQLQTGGNLTLLASDILTVQDSSSQPFRVLVGNDLLLQGNSTLNISILDHPDSGLTADRNILLRSNNPIVIDAYFTAGGNFSGERLNGTPAALMSIEDPVIEVAGNVDLGDYTGASLQVLAGGNVTGGTLEIDSAGGPFNDSTVELSNGISQTISGTTEPTLDIRAGTTTFFETPSAGTPEGANITIDNIINPGGLVFLTNQFAANPALSGNIAVGAINTVDFNGGGDIVIDSKGSLTTTFVDASGGDVFGFLSSFDPSLFNGNGGNLTFLAEGAITLPMASEVYTYGLENGSATFQSDTAITQGEASFFEGSTVGFGTGGTFSFEAPLISLNGGVSTFLDGEGTGGRLRLVADTFEAQVIDFATVVFGFGSAGDVSIEANDINLDNAFVGSQNRSFSEGTAGNVTVNTNTLTAINGAQIASFTSDFVIGDAGDVTVIASEFISLDGILSGGDFFDFTLASGIFSSIDLEAVGNGGQVNIVTDVLSVTNGAQIRAGSLGFGDGGTINIQANESITIDGAVFDTFENTTFASNINSEVAFGGEGQPGSVTITTDHLSLTNGGVISVSTDSLDDAGDIVITASESVTFDGVTAFDIPGLSEEVAVRESGLRSEALELATGNGGNVVITTPLLVVANGATLQASTLGAGNAGSFKLNVDDLVLVEGDGSAILANAIAGSTGNGGSIVIDPALITVRDGGQISVASAGTGEAGDIAIQGDTLLLDQGSISAETFSNTGGNIVLDINDLIVMLDNSRISTTAGTALAGGDGGNVDLSTTFLVASPEDGNSDITANAFSGSGGSVVVTAEGVFGIAPLSRAELENLLGTSDPEQLDPANLASNDITAISQENPSLEGNVIILSPDLDPSQGVIALPDTVIDASRLIAQGCSSSGAIAQEIGSLIVTGRGGLPTNPTETLSGSQLLLDWATVETTIDDATTEVTTTETPIADTPRQIQEVQSLAVRPDGQVVLLAQGNRDTPPNAWLPSLTCAGEIHEDSL